MPDISFPVTVDASEFGESTYDNALPWTRIAAVPHVRYGNFAPMLPQLDALHEARVAKDKEFQWWSQDVAEFRAEQAKKYVSLNEAERRAERDKQEAKRVQRQAERKALGLDADPLADDLSDDGLQVGERDIAADAARREAGREASGSAAARIGRDPRRRHRTAGAGPEADRAGAAGNQGGDALGGVIRRLPAGIGYRAPRAPDIV